MPPHVRSRIFLFFVVGEKIKVGKVGRFAGQHNRLLRRQHCSSLCSQSEGHEHVANMTSALGHDFIGFLAHTWPPQYSLPSLCEQSELQCFASNLRQMSARCPLQRCRTRLLFGSKTRRDFLYFEHPTFQGQSSAPERPGNSLIRLIRCYAV